MAYNVKKMNQCPTNQIEGQLWIDTVLDGIELDGENRDIETGIIESSPDRHIQYTIGSKKLHRNLRERHEHKWDISSESMHHAQHVKVAFTGCYSLPHKGKAQ